MKGIELPINILIIVAIAVIVLIALVAMFYPAFSGGSSVVTTESAKSAACQILVGPKKCGATTPRPTNTSEITISGFDANRDGIVGDNQKNTINSGTGANFPTTCSSPPATNYDHDNLASLCICYYSITNERLCKALCGC